MGYTDENREKLDIRKFTVIDYLAISFAAVGLTAFCYFGLWV